MLIRSREEPCHACSGASPAREACDRCGTRGVIYVPCAKTCPECKGVRGVTCQRCDSWGFVPDYGFEFSAGGAVAVAPAALPTPQFRTVTLTRAMVGAHSDPEAYGWGHWLRVGGDGGVSIELLRPASFAGVDRFVGVERPDVGVEVVSDTWLTAQWCPLDGDNRIAPWEAP